MEVSDGNVLDVVKTGKRELMSLERKSRCLVAAKEGTTGR